MFRITGLFLLLLWFPVEVFSAAPATAQRLPTGVDLAPSGETFDVGNMPLAAVLSSDGKIVVSLSGFREQGIQIADPVSNRVVQTIPQQGAFLGLVFSRDGHTLYASGANENVIHVYDWKDGSLHARSKIKLRQQNENKTFVPYPAEIALSPDGSQLYVAENCSDTIAVIDLKTETVIDRKPAGHYPYGVVVDRNGGIYVSAWGDNTITRFNFSRGRIVTAETLNVVRHPSAMMLNKNSSRLYVASGSSDSIAVVSTHPFRVLHTMEDPPPATTEGSTPNALALSADGRKLFVAEATNNSVAVFALSDASTGQKNGIDKDQLLGRIPVGWYPTALLSAGKYLYVINGKGRGTRANPGAAQVWGYRKTPTEYTLGQLNGTITILVPTFSLSHLRELSDTVTRLNHWNSPKVNVSYPPFHHVLYIIKENRTYDQVFGDMPQGDSDPSLVFFPRRVSPNHHAIADRFGLFDRFFVNAEVSTQGHPWSTSAYVTDYTEKTVQSNYSDRREDESLEDEVGNPANGYLWDLAERAKKSLRIYGEYAIASADQKKYHSVKKTAIPYTSSTYPPYNLNVQDQERVDAWLEEFHQFEKEGEMPALQIFHLPNDHTAGATSGMPTPAAYVADNDLALGRIVEAVSNSEFWKDTILFVVEDDSQSGPDHVDSHRSVLLVISAYNKPGVLHRFVNTTDVLATIEKILVLSSLSQFDYYGRPLQGIFSDQADLRPYKAIIPEQSLKELNPDNANAKQSLLLKLDKEDLSDDDLFNRILWQAVKGDRIPFPGVTHLSLLQIRQEQ